MIRIEIDGSNFDEFMHNLDSFMVMVLGTTRQQPTPAAPATDTVLDPKAAEIIPPEPEKKTRGRPKKEAPTIDATAETAETYALGDVRAALMELIKHADEAAALDLLKDKGGTAKLKDVPAEKYAAVIKAAHIEIDRVKATA
jgi:hypothetical protein